MPQALALSLLINALAFSIFDSKIALLYSDGPPKIVSLESWVESVARCSGELRLSASSLDGLDICFGG